MKLAFFAPEFYNSWGGVGIYSIQLLRELSKFSDLEIHVVTPDINDARKKKKVNAMFKNIRVHTLSKAQDSFVYNLKFQLSVANEFKKLHEIHSFDIVHAANLVHMPDIFLKWGDIGVPSVVTAHTTIHGQVSGFLKSNKNPFKMAPTEKWSIATYPAIRALEWQYLRKTPHMITVSEKFKKIFEKEYNYKGKIVVTHNTIDLKHFDYDKVSSKTAVKKYPLLQTDKPIIFFAGRLITQKGIDVLVDSLALLEARGIKYSCLIAGMGDDARLKKLIAGMKNVHYVGYVPNPDLAYIYKQADIFVLPSFYENFPISLLEAMSMKCCCLATDVGAVDEIINSRNGIMIPPGDHVALASKIEQLIQNPDRMKKMAETACKHIHKNHKPELMAQKTMKFYEEIA